MSVGRVAAPAHFDAAVLGGGPAGIAAAVTLRRAGLRVTLLERAPLHTPRVGESLSPEVRPLLEQLGAWDAVRAFVEGAPEFTLVRSAWGAAELLERPSVLHPLGAGWHVDRVAVDSALTAWCRDQGVEVRTGDGRWFARSPDAARSIEVGARGGASLRVGSVVDATGRGATGTSAVRSVPWLAHDRQVALLGLFEGSGSTPAGPGLVLEAHPQGFWYTAPLSEDRLVAVFVTDADLLPSLGQGPAVRFRRALGDASHTRARLAGRHLAGKVQGFRSESGRLPVAAGPGWRAVGDAAMSTDPLGGMGVTRGLTSGLAVLATPSAAAAEVFSDYLDQRTRVYWQEPRWPRSAFWARRRPCAPRTDETLDWRSVAVELPPDAVLRWRGPAEPAAEAWLSPAALAALEALGEAAAQTCVRAVNEAAPMSARRVVVALQWLLAAGIMEERA